MVDACFDLGPDDFARRNRLAARQQRREARFPELQLATQIGARLQQALEAVTRTPEQGPEHVLGGKHLRQSGVFVFHASRHARSCTKPRRTQLLKVPRAAFTAAESSGRSEEKKSALTSLIR